MANDKVSEVGLCSLFTNKNASGLQVKLGCLLVVTIRLLPVVILLIMTLYFSLATKPKYLRCYVMLACVTISVPVSCFRKFKYELKFIMNSSLCKSSY